MGLLQAAAAWARWSVWERAMGGQGASRALCTFAKTLNFLGNALNPDAESNSSALWQSGFQSSMTGNAFFF